MARALNSSVLERNPCRAARSLKMKSLASPGLRIGSERSRGAATNKPCAQYRVSCIGRVESSVMLRAPYPFAQPFAVRAPGDTDSNEWFREQSSAMREHKYAYR